jgi:hypothetical protein
MGRLAEPRVIPAWQDSVEKVKVAANVDWDKLNKLATPRRPKLHPQAQYSRSPRHNFTDGGMGGTGLAPPLLSPPVFY